VSLEGASKNTDNHRATAFLCLLLTPLQHHLYRLSGKEAQVIFARQQFPVLISCSL